jgi:hypothetical protein
MFLTYGRNVQNELIHISEAKRGTHCGLLCPFCGGPLLARKGKVVSHHFAHQGRTCGPAALATEHFIPSYEGYFTYGLTSAQRQIMDQVLRGRGDDVFFEADSIRSMTLKALADKRFLRVIYVPDRFERARPLARLTAKGQAFGCRLNLLAFAEFMQVEYQRSLAALSVAGDNEAATSLKLLQAELQRIEQTAFYLLRIEAAEQTFFKIGITSRPIGERVQEVAAFLRGRYDVQRITPLFYLRQVAYIEGYFKAKFAHRGLVIEHATEYFTFPDFEPVRAELAALEGFSLNLAQSLLSVVMPARPRFRACFERIDRLLNDFTGRYDPFVLLVDIVNLDAGGKAFADFLHLAYGKQFEALSHLHRGDVIEFNAAIDGSTLKRPTKLELRKDV